jgi:5-(carboxyamino)imidazole ribonucleotide synthase
MTALGAGLTLGILGGGQLGRMIALAAARLGIHAHIFCTAADEPAVEVAQRATVAAFDDGAALEAFARAVDVVTLEWENVPLAALQRVAAFAPVRPGVELMRMAQDRRLEKRAAQAAGLGTAPFADVTTADELAAAVAALGRPAILKTACLGYDGKGQVLIDAATDPLQAWEQLGRAPCVLEGFVDFAAEASILVVRRLNGETAAYPVVRNTHRQHILYETQAPGGFDPAIEAEAHALALRLAERVNLVGLLAIELFILKSPNAAGQRVLLNEIAPRPHNSGHWTIDACACSQFEQIVRAVGDLPLGSTTPHRQALMRNLLGHDIDAARDLLADPTACLHLYGKKEAREGRKMGHVTFLRGPWDTGSAV